MLLYCAFLFRFVWMLASRAGLDTPGIWRRDSLFVGLSGGKRYRMSKTSAPGEFAGRNAQSPGAPLCAPLLPACLRKQAYSAAETAKGRLQAPRAFGRIRPHFRGSACILQMGRTTPLLPQRAPPPSSPEGAAAGEAYRYENNCLVHIISHILSGDRSAGADSAMRARCASVRAALVAKYGCDPIAELELQVWWHLIVEGLVGEPSDWNAMCWSGRDSGGAEAAGSGGMCARLLRTAGPPGHFVPVGVDAPETSENPIIRKEDPVVPGETKPERARRIERDRKVRAANRLAVETPNDKKARLEIERAAQRRAAGTHESRDEAARSQKRRAGGAHESRDLAARSQKRRADGTRESRAEAARPQKRRADGTHESREEEARPQKRRADGTHESRDVAARPKQRHVGETHGNLGSRDMRRQAPPSPGYQESDTELEVSKLFYGSGVAYIPGGSGEPYRERGRRRNRMRLLSRRTGGGPNWRDG